ncbi:uncharacterized protein P884DRAFT_194557 [Thermothelomyces heterothallicus CBS 202.75]|uniref:uncharacterized protein n=1 Tax=Thermothelomyces heterothallicus CBS 202.75 TaxID=1149848 RepID=UPI0037437DBB
MKLRENDIKSAGLTLLYEPDWPIDPVVDIILVHGIGGHPVFTWKLERQGQMPPTPKTTASPHSGTKRRLTKSPAATSLLRSNSEPLLARNQRSLSRSRIPAGKNSADSSPRVGLDRFAEPGKPGSLGRSRTVLRKASPRLSPRERVAETGTDEPGLWAAASDVDAYWPLDFLPASCPGARVFTWGYHTLVSNRKALLPQGDIFAHAQELLIELASTRTALGAAARPLLRLSEAERDGPLKEILLSTCAVVFLGSPHRGTEHCNLGDAVQSMAVATLHTDPSDSLLREVCGIRALELELGRQTFVKLWNEYNFKVKTFQESVIASYQYPELRAETTIRRLASFIGDPRENPETIYALHNDICKFGSAQDQGYRALVKTLAAIITTEEDGRASLNARETECLLALSHTQPAVPEPVQARAYPGTCLWLYDLHEFQTWCHRNGPHKQKILWIRGESGSGKTILLRSLQKRLERQWGPAGASFIWVAAEADDLTGGANTGHHGSGPASIYRSLLARLFLQDPSLRKALLALYNQTRDEPQTFDDAQISAFFADYYANQTARARARRTFIFVEVSDDACPSYVHELLGRLSLLAHNSDFSICLASGHHPEIIEEENVISIPMHLRNADDILRYVNLNLIAGWQERNRTVNRIAEKSTGVFLWAEIVVNILNAAIMEGATRDMIEHTVEEIPGDLHGLYEWMLSTLNDRERAESLLLFQWVMLAAEPMRLNDLFLAIRLTEPDPFALFERLGPLMAFDIGMPFSMRELRQLRNSEISSDTPSQFYRWLRARSTGLLDLKSDNDRRQGHHANETLGLQRVYPIHPSVRKFFLSGRGFACLTTGNPSIPSGLPLSDFFDITHYTILRACLTYLNMRDFEALGHGCARRSRHKPSPPTTSSSSSLSSSSFLTSPSSPGQRQDVTFVETTLHWHPPPTVSSQRHLVMSSYPFLRYAVAHLLHHLLAPVPFRYFLPQAELLAVLAANRFRLWKRWTSLLGTYDPDVIIAQHASPSRMVAAWLSPVYGARYRLRRVLRKLARLAASDSYVQLVALFCRLARHNTHAARPPMYALGGHARRTLLPRAMRCVCAQQANYAAASKPSATLELPNDIAASLHKDGSWAAMRGKRKGKNTDKYRVNIVSEKLCDDTLNYIKSTLTRHEGCDLIDIFPGAGVWSQKLNDLLRPRSHILMEPDEEFYKPYLQPLLDRPGARLLPESGIVWEQLNKILSPEVLPHQVERRYSPKEMPERNDTLLVTMNLAMYPKRRFRTFESLAQLVLFQVISSIRPGGLFQKYGLVRMLIWAENSEKMSVLPRTVQRRKKMAIEAEIATDWVCEIVGGEQDISTSGRTPAWFQRDDALDLESTMKTAERMRAGGFEMLPGREPQHLREFLEVAKLNDPAAFASKHTHERPYMAELEALEAAYLKGELSTSSKEHKRYKSLLYLRNHTLRRSEMIVKMMEEYYAIIQAHIDAGSNEKLLAKARKRGQAWGERANSLEQAARSDLLLHRDNLHILRQESPILNWDRRYVEPLRATPAEFFPQVPCTLLDIQPKAVPGILRDMGQHSTRGGDTFDLILRGLVQRPIDPVTKSLNSIAAGAGEGIVPRCPSLLDPRKGGIPPGLPEQPTRTLSQSQMVEIAEAWMTWPFRPSYSELVSRTLEDMESPDEEDGKFAMSE